MCQLYLLISWPYVNIMKYPFNHVISEVRQYFWGMIHHGTWKYTSENCKMLFWLISNFCHFLPPFEFCISFLASNGKISAYMINSAELFLYWNQLLHFIVLKLVMIGQNWLAVSKRGQKLAKNWKFTKKAFCNFLSHLCMYYGVSYLKKIAEPRWLHG